MFRSAACFSLSLAAALSAIPPPLSELGGVWTDVLVCASSSDSPREVCAGPGVNQQSCMDLGCCWDQSNYSLPWCYLPNIPASWSDSQYQAYSVIQAVPSAQSLRGGLQASFDGDVAAVSCIMMPPYIGNCDYDYGNAAPAFNFPSNLTINGGALNALPRSKWTPYGLQRIGSSDSGAQLTTEARLLNSEAAVLVRINVGSLNVGSTATVSAFLPMLIRDFANSTWGWDTPVTSADLSQFAHSVVEVQGMDLVVSVDNTSDAVAAASVWTDSTAANVTVDTAPLGTGVAGRVTWSFVVNTDIPISFGFLLYVGRDVANVTAAAAQLGGASFPSTWVRVQDEMDALWNATFVSPNPYFSGSLPVIAPGGNITQAMSTVYYGSVLSLLQCLKYPPMLPEGHFPTNASGSYPFGQWTLPSAGPQKAVTTQYLWDTAYASPIFARLEPKGYRAILESLLEADPHAHYALDTVSLQPVGPWYSFNDLAMHLLLTSYADFASNGDPLGFWGGQIGGMRAIDWLDLSANFWRTLPRVPSANDSSTVYLADYGGASNLLECVPTYLHAVPALNAANVWMMNSTAAIWRALGNTTRADELSAAAEALLPLVLAQYARDNVTNEGLGYFACLYPDGERVGVQHCIDFLTISQAIGPQLPQDMRSEMLSFVQQDLLTTSWMRALALDDPAAPRSDRADHGPFGAYDSWPALTISGMLALGYTDEAVAMLDRVAPVLQEGPFGQSHRVYDNPLLPQLQTAKSTTDQQYFASNGASFAATVLQLAGL
jgi:hypothetical protein